MPGHAHLFGWAEEKLREALTAAVENHTGAMVALVPPEDDLDRLTVEGGEPREDLHLTLWFLGKAADWSAEQRDGMVNGLRSMVENREWPLLTVRGFGANHWNPGGDAPCWVLGIGDLGPGDRPDGQEDLAVYRGWVRKAWEDGSMEPWPAPDQHTPWAPHICLAYTDDLAMVDEVVKRVGPVNLDRLRVAFGTEVTDIPLGGAVTAASRPEGLRRQPSEAEMLAGTDFLALQSDWREAVDGVLTEWAVVVAAWRADLAEQITRFIDAGTLDRLADLVVDTTRAVALLAERLMALASRAQGEQIREAAGQGIEIDPPEIDGARIRELAQTTADLLGNSLALSAGRRALALAEQDAPGARVAAEVDTHLAGLSDATPRTEIGGAMTSAANIARMDVLEAAPRATYYASEILDANCCKPCRRIDLTSFPTLAEVREAYPNGLYRRCDGGVRCRGQVVAVWERPQALAAGGTLHDQETAPGADMPWHKEHGHAECPEGEPWAVVRDSNGHVEGCHSSESGADDQIAALYASEDDALSAGGDPNPGTDKDKRLKKNRKDMAKEPEGEQGGECPAGQEKTSGGKCRPMWTTENGAWQGVLTMEGIETGDGREFARTSLEWDITEGNPVLPLMWTKATSAMGGHDGAVRVGSVLEVWRDGDAIMGRGVFDLGGPEDDDAHEAYRRMRDGHLTGNSVDVDSVKDADVEYVFPEPQDGEEEDILGMLFASPDKVIFHKGRIRGTTLCEFPAFTEARLSLVTEDEAAAATEAAAQAERANALVAAAPGGDDWAPPAEWFADPQFTVPVPITVTDEGRIYGHAAQWGQCHLGHAEECVTPPHEEAHPYFLTGEVVCAAGERVSVGQITVGTGHAPLYASAPTATEHYDNTGCAVADVTVGNDPHGIWVAGAVRPGVDRSRIRELQASGQLSGDWRRIGGSLRLVGLLAVNVPGFPVPALRARVASGQPQALIAAGRLSVSRGMTGSEMSRMALRTMADRLAERFDRSAVSARGE